MSGPSAHISYNLKSLICSKCADIGKKEGRSQVLADTALQQTAEVVEEHRSSLLRGNSCQGTGSMDQCEGLPRSSSSLRKACLAPWA